MHIALSWDITASGPRWTTINDALREELKYYPWVRPLSTFYIVNISTGEQRDSIVDALTAVAKRFPEKIYFVVTPPMSGGGYNGWLPKDLWDKINERAK
jgi:hypothetical protein